MTLLDNDWYNFLMGDKSLSSPILKDVRVTYELINRSNIKLKSFINIKELDSILNNLINYTLNFSEKQYLYDNGISRHYLDLVDNQNTIKSMEFYIDDTFEDYQITYRGPLYRSILIETPLLAIINSYCANKMTKYIKEYNTFLNKEFIKKTFKLEILKNLFLKFNFTEFGTRRRYSLEYQKEIINKLFNLNEKIGFTGTSNVMLAQENNSIPLGTIAHQWMMLYAALYVEEKENDNNFLNLINSQIQAIKDWNNIETPFLTDTYGSDFFFKYIAPVFKDIGFIALRQDSGDIKYRCNQIMNYFLDNNIEKGLLIPSDGVTLDSMEIILKDMYKHPCNCDINFGWGSNLTNDGIHNPMSIVIKPIMIHTNFNDNNCIKLSDNINKAIGKKSLINKYQKLTNIKQDNIKVIY